MLTSREKNIINYLEQVQGYTTVKELADLFHLSDRSIQYDLENIEDYANKKGVKITRNKRFGIKINKQSIVNQKSINAQEGYIFFSPKARMHKIILHLLSAIEPISSNKLAQSLFVTRRTIVDDLKSVEKWLADSFLELEYITNKGFSIKGEEQKVREAYAEILKKLYNIHDISSHFEEIDNNTIQSLINIVECVLDVEGYKIIQNAKDELIFHVITTVYRINRNLHLHYKDEVLQKLRDEEEFYIANQMQKDIQEKCGFYLSESDVGYITLHLLGAKQDSNLNLEVTEKQYFQKSIESFIKNVSGFMGVDLTSDSELINGLTIHLKPVINRMKYQLRYNNPLKEEIQDQYPEIVETVKNSVTVLEKAFKVELDMDEITYLALHIGSAIERNFEKTRYSLKVIIVCASGVGTSQLLKGKIENYYPELKVHDTFSVYDIKDDYFENNGINFVITTIPISDFPIPVIHVTPFLNRNDRKKLNDILIAEREKAIETGLTPGPKLNELLLPELISLDVNVSNWEEAISASTQLLISKGIVAESYTKAIKEKIKNHGPYMVIDEGIAMPHAKPSDGVNRPGFSFVKLKTPISFGHKRHDPVSIIICLATMNAHIHLNALRQLTLLLQNEEKMNQIMQEGLSTMVQLIEEFSEY